jgi:hypothetical protein
VLRVLFNSVTVLPTMEGNYSYRRQPLLLAGNSVQCESHLPNGAAMLLDADVVNRQHCQLYPRRQARIYRGTAPIIHGYDMLEHTAGYTASLVELISLGARSRGLMARYSTQIIHYT